MKRNYRHHCHPTYKSPIMMMMMINGHRCWNFHVAVTEPLEPDAAQFEFRSALDVPCAETTESTRDKLLSAVGHEAELVTSELSCLRIGTCSLDTPRLTGCSSVPGHAQNDRKRRAVAPSGVNLLVTMTYRLRHTHNHHFPGTLYCLVVLLHYTRLTASFPGQPG